MYMCFSCTSECVHVWTVLWFEYVEANERLTSKRKINHFYSHTTLTSMYSTLSSIYVEVVRLCCIASRYWTHFSSWTKTHVPFCHINKKRKEQSRIIVLSSLIYDNEANILFTANFVIIWVGNTFINDQELRDFKSWTCILCLINVFQQSVLLFFINFINQRAHLITGDW